MSYALAFLISLSGTIDCADCLESIDLLDKGTLLKAIAFYVGPPSAKCYEVQELVAMRSQLLDEYQLTLVQLMSPSTKK